MPPAKPPFIMNFESELPRDWLQTRLLPSDLIPMEELEFRFEKWLAAKEEASVEPIRDVDGNLNIYLDPITGVPRFGGAPVPPDPVDILVEAIHYFGRRSDNYPLKDWLLGDELWRFSSSPESWMGMVGRAGFVWLRAGKPHRVVVTMVC